MKIKHRLDYLLRSMDEILLNMKRLYAKPEPCVSLTTTRCTQQAIIYVKMDNALRGDSV